MNPERAADSAARATSAGGQPESGSEHGRTVEEIRGDFGNTVQEIKEKYTALLELRDRKIQRLEGTLARGARQEAKRRLLLVIDDAQSTAEIMGRYLQGRPVKIVCVAGRQALEQLRLRDYDEIVIEAACVVEPDVDGLALFQQVCEDGGSENVIVMSSRPGDSIRNAVEQAGARFLRKPFRPEQLLELLGGAFLGEQE